MVGQRSYNSLPPDHLHNQAMTQAYRPLPDAQLLWDTFSYNPLTGRLHWLRKTSDKVIVGREAGSLIKATGYLKIGLDGTNYQVHRIIWKWLHGSEPEQVDHANLCRSDNRAWNLRNCSQAQNAVNSRTRRDNTSGFKGAYFHRAGKKKRQKQWQAKCGDHSLGYYATPEEAHAAYCAKATELHGHFHRAA